MRKQLNKIYIALFAILFMPILAFSAEQAPYVPLAGKIPGLNNMDDLGSYMNALFNVAIMLGVILSVLIIAYSGLEYMTIDVATKKGMAKMRIRRAIIGLLMLLATYLIFAQINPEILNLQIFGK